MLYNFSFTVASTDPTHNRGGTLDVVASTGTVEVIVRDAGISIITRFDGGTWVLQFRR
jgi:hypothetical protein